MRLSTVSPLLILGVLVLFNQEAAQAGTVTIDFEQFSDGTPLTSQIPGLTFSNATVISAGISLNEFEFPPHSGTNVIFDDGGPISIFFDAPILSFGGYFTYTVPLTLLAFGVGSNQVGQAVSLFSNNLALSGDTGSSPNEFLGLSSAFGISGVTVSGDLRGASFTVDDVTVTSAAPEPPTTFLLLSALAGLLAIRKITSTLL